MIYFEVKQMVFTLFDVAKLIEGVVFINQIPQWSGKTPRVWEFRSIGSHNYDEVFSHMNEA